MAGSKTIAALRRAVENHVDVIVSGGPGIFEIAGRRGFKAGPNFVAQPIQSRPQRTPPFLVPVAAASGIARTVSAPASYVVHTAPGRIFENLHYVLGRMQRQKFGIVGDRR